MALSIVLIVVGLMLLLPTLVVLGRHQRHGRRGIGAPALVILLAAVVAVGLGITIFRAAGS